MPLIQVVITLIVIGVLLGLVNRFIPMQSNIKSILNGIVVIAVVLWIVNLFGLFSSISKIHKADKFEVDGKRVPAYGSGPATAPRLP